MEEVLFLPLLRFRRDDPDLKALFEDEDRWAEKEARKAWDEETRKSGRILT